jgi:hypothetical protein
MSGLTSPFPPHPYANKPKRENEEGGGVDMKVGHRTETLGDWETLSQYRPTPEFPPP